MEKPSSKKGAVSCHTIKAKGGCMQHNRRTQSAANVDPSRSHLNSSWESDRIKRLSSTRSLVRQANKLYEEKVGQKCQASFAPLKESCVVVKDGCTMGQARRFAKMVEERTGIECLGIWFHRDEGSAKSKYVPDEPYECNLHIHFLWDCQDKGTGKAIPLKRPDMCHMQDWAADAFGMERGTPAALTGRRHIRSSEYKIQAMAGEYVRLRDTIGELEKEKAGLLAKIEDSWRYRSRARELEGEISRLKAAIEEKDKSIAGLEKRAENASNRLEEAKKRIDALLDDKEKLRRDVSLYKVRFEHWKAEYDELKGKEESRGNRLRR